jgi:hypothetical protein
MTLGMRLPNSNNTMIPTTIMVVGVIIAKIGIILGTLCKRRERNQRQSRAEAKFAYSLFYWQVGASQTEKPAI